MAILPKPQTIEGNLGDFGYETSQFQVAVNSKTFKVLIDKLYTNKIGSIIRELSTNAFDSHVAAGIADRPFHVELPTMLSPVFRIRDYGVSLTHEQVMRMYVTIFESTKENTNSQVGAFGLGSKSPFSYTDSFTVRAYMDGKVRSYLVGYDNTGIPNITHLKTEISEEEQGFEVSFPVNVKDFQEFRTNAYNVYRYFDVPPVGTHINFSRVTPVFESSDWKIVSTSGYGESQFQIRQGCVVYPVSQELLTSAINLNYGYSAIVNVPIGSVSVAASREALSMEDDTKRYLSEVARRVRNEIGEALNSRVKDAPTVLEATKEWVKVNSIARVSGLYKVYQDKKGISRKILVDQHYIRIPAKNDKLPTMVPLKGKDPSGGFWHFNVSAIGAYRFYVDDGSKVLRKTLRIREASQDHRDTAFLLTKPTGKQLSRLVRLLGLRPQQIISVAGLPDVDIIKAPQGQKSGIYKLVWNQVGLTKAKDSDIIGDYYWLPVDKGGDNLKIDLPLISVDDYNRSTQGRLLVALFRAKQNIGLDSHPVFLLTKNAQKRLDLPEDKRLDKAIVAGYAAQADDYTEKFKIVFLKQMMKGTVFSYFYPDGALPTPYDNDTYTRRLLMSARIKGESLAKAEYADLKDNYPLLFGEPDIQQIKQYVNLVKDRSL